MTYKDSQAKLVEYQRREEQQRKNYVENHKGPCVPWRGAGGEIGRCIYCGKTHTKLSTNVTLLNIDTITVA